MRVLDILKTKVCGSAYRISLYECASQLVFPFPKTRKAILRKLEQMNLDTEIILDGYIAEDRANIFIPETSGLTAVEIYMLAQRWRCGIDVLSRLVDAETADIYFELHYNEFHHEDDLMLRGFWREFGQNWLNNLSWRISESLETWREPIPDDESPAFAPYMVSAALARFASKSRQAEDDNQ